MKTRTWDNRVQLAPLARRRAVPTTESEWVPVVCANDEVAKCGRTGICFLGREPMDCIMHYSLGDNTIYQEQGTIWRRDNPSPSGRICSIEGRPIQERRRIPIARPRGVAMRWKCHGNVSAEMSFNLGKRSCGEGLMSRWFVMRQGTIVSPSLTLLLAGRTGWLHLQRRQNHLPAPPARTAPLRSSPSLPSRGLLARVS